jgi:transposase
MQKIVLVHTLSPLRKCKHCGLEAHTEKELEAFKKDKKGLHGRTNVCKKCAYNYPVKHVAEWHQRGFGIVNPEILEAWNK